MRPSLRPVMTFVLLGTAAAVPAFAQTSAGDPGPSQYAVCSGKPAQADTDAAHGAYMAGKGSFDEADYTTAINYFKDAYRRDCTKHELLVIIARAYELQGNRREAVHALETYLERVPSATDAEVQRRHIANLKREITEQPAASASASSSSAPTPAASVSAVPVDAGPAGSAFSSPPPPVASSSGHSAGPWVLVIAGGVAAVTGGVLLGVGTSQVSSAEQVCGSTHDRCPAGSSAISQGNSGRTLESVGVSVGAVGLAAVVGGLIWHFVEAPARSEAEGPKSGRPSVSPQVGPGFAGAAVSGSF